MYNQLAYGGHRAGLAVHGLLLQLLPSGRVRDAGGDLADGYREARSPGGLGGGRRGKVPQGARDFPKLIGMIRSGLKSILATHEQLGLFGKTH